VRLAKGQSVKLRKIVGGGEACVKRATLPPVFLAAKM
jgi:hypothetical protein